MFIKQIGKALNDAWRIGHFYLNANRHRHRWRRARVRPLHDNQQLQLSTFHRQCGFNQRNGVPAAGKQHNKGELIAEHRQTAIFYIAAATADVAGNGVNDTRTINAKSSDDQMMRLWLRQNEFSCTFANNYK
ncbi:hypothetical protein COLO4_00514, partial [Corchorus olitorius]